MFVCAILFTSLCKCTVSNAFDVSNAFAIFLSSDFFLLNPVVIVVFCIVKCKIQEIKVCLFTYRKRLVSKLNLKRNVYI